MIKTIQPNMTCPLTGRNVKYENLGDFKYYELNIASSVVEIFLCSNCSKKLKLNNNDFAIISGLIANHKWPARASIVSKECNASLPAESEAVIVSDFLSTVSFPKTPKEKMDNFFLNLSKIQIQDGDLVKINLQDEKIWTKNFFKSVEECMFYFDGLVDSGSILWRKTGAVFPEYAFRITHLGLNNLIQLQEVSSNSDNCFIAMAFIDEMNPYREAIKRALSATDFKPIIIDEEHLASDKTIPDGILTGIKKSKFCIADFTYHRKGVYFESGYAVGLGKQVIYLCRSDEFEKAHFDIKQLQHIIYNSVEELEKKLIDKINAWIK